MYTVSNLCCADNEDKENNAMIKEAIFFIYGCLRYQMLIY